MAHLDNFTSAVALGAIGAILLPTTMYGLSFVQFGSAPTQANILQYATYGFIVGFASQYIVRYSGIS